MAFCNSRSFCFDENPNSTSSAFRNISCVLWAVTRRSDKDGYIIHSQSHKEGLGWVYVQNHPRLVTVKEFDSGYSFYGYEVDRR